MVQICDETLVLPLLLFFQFSSDTGTFPNYWKRGNLTTVHKKVVHGMLKIIDQYLFFQYLVKFLKIAVTIQSIVILSKMNCFHLVNLAFVRIILAFLTCCLLHKKFLRDFTRTLRYTHVAYF